MSRTELIAFVKNHESLKQFIKQTENVNYVNLPTTVLREYVQDYKKCGKIALILRRFVNKIKNAL